MRRNISTGCVECNELPVAEPATVVRCEHHPVVAQRRASIRQRQLQYQRSATRRPCGQGEALLEARGCVLIPLDHSLALDLYARALVRNLALWNRRERGAAADTRPAQCQQFRVSSLRAAVVHANARGLEIGAQTVLSIGSLETAIIAARLVLPRLDRALHSGERVACEIVGRYGSRFGIRFAVMCKIAGCEAQAGDVVRVRVEAVDEDFDLVATLVEEAPAS